jgi:hypothetical protein
MLYSLSYLKGIHVTLTVGAVLLSNIRQQQQRKETYFQSQAYLSAPFDLRHNPSSPAIEDTPTLFVCFSSCPDISVWPRTSIPVDKHVGMQ